MKAKVFVFLISLITFLAWSSETKYQVIRVTNAGWIKGKVLHANRNMQIPKLEADVDTHVCGEKTKKLQAIDLGQNGALRNVVVYLKDISAGKEFRLSEKPPVLTQKGCSFDPHVQVVPPFSSIRILNEDKILHGVHAFQNQLGTKFVLFPHSTVYPAKTLFNIAMVAERKESFQQLGGPGIVKVICDAGHNWMTSYFVVLPHPYFGQVDNNGDYKILDVPLGKFILVAWHEYLGTLEKPVEVKSNQPVLIDFTYTDEL